MATFNRSLFAGMGCVICLIEKAKEGEVAATGAVVDEIMMMLPSPAESIVPEGHAVAKDFMHRRWHFRNGAEMVLHKCKVRAGETLTGSYECKDGTWVLKLKQ